MAKETNFPDPPKGHIAVVGWDAVNERWQAVAVDASGLLQADLADVADRQVNAHGYDGSAWRKLALVWGYTDRWAEDLGFTKSGAGAKTILSTVVPEGEVWVLQAASVRNTSGTITGPIIGVYDGSAYCEIRYEATLAQWVPMVYTGAIALKEGDRVRMYLGGLGDGDVVEAAVRGYKMNVTQ